MADNAGLRAAHRRAADAGRRAAEAAGARPTKVTIRTRTYSGAVNAAGTTLLSTSDVVLSPRPKVVPAGEGESSLYGGGLEAHPGTLGARSFVVGPITLDYPGGGYSLATLLPAESPSTRVTLVLEGDGFEASGEEFDLVAQPDASRPHQITLTVARSRQGS